MSDESTAEPVGPNLEIVLLANGSEIARSADRRIWLEAMASLTGVSAHLMTATTLAPVVRTSDAGSVEGGPVHEQIQPQSVSVRGRQSPLDAFASELNVSREALEAAAYPTEAEPYIQIDAKYWEAFKKKPGYGRIAPSVLVATLLLLWDRQIQSIGEIGTRECAKVAGAIGLNDKNPTRSISNCDWLQLRGKIIKLNPSMISRAEEVAVAYCLART